MPHGASLQRSYATYVSIIAFGMNMLMIYAKWRGHMTIARRMREYYCIRHGYSHNEYSICYMREYYCLSRGHSHDECSVAWACDDSTPIFLIIPVCMVSTYDSALHAPYYRLRGYCSYYNHGEVNKEKKTKEKKMWNNTKKKKETRKNKG